MAFELALGDLQKDDELTANKILETLLNPKNINMKTHILTPVTFAILESIIMNLESLLTEINKEKKVKLPLTTKILKDTIVYLKQFMVSWNRLSREEITKTLQSIRQEGSGERSFWQKMIGTNK